MIGAPGSCFVDCIEIVWNVPAEWVRSAYALINPHHDPDVDGYHPSIAAAAFHNVTDRGLFCLDVIPVNADGRAYGPGPTDYFMALLQKRYFKAVLAGQRLTNGQPHSIAFIDGTLYESNGVAIDEPTISLAEIWCTHQPEVRA